MTARRISPFELEADQAIVPTPTARRTRAARDGADARGRTYADFVVALQRLDARRVGVAVRASPVGRLAPVAVAFPAAEAAALRDSFVSGNPGGTSRALITQEEAAAIGRRLSAVLLPAPVFGRLERCLAQAARAGQGLRVRLVAEPGLIDLPWEYLVRPDRADAGGVSAFLLFDPAISFVRLAPKRGAQPAPAEGAQRLAFVGTFWEGRVDGWEVWREFDQLRRGLEPLRRYILPEFAVASDLDVFDAGLASDTAIFHYAGHVDFDAAGRALCVRELPRSMNIAHARTIHVAEVAKSLRRTGTRLAVMSACNSGFWPAVQPLVAAGIPAVIGLNGAVASATTIEFFTRLYESLGLGLGLDEAAAAARRATMEWGAKNGLFDWGLFMVYVQAPDPVLFPRAATPAVTTKRKAVRRRHADDISATVARARELEGMNFGELMSHMIERRVLILGRFSGRRLPILKAIQRHLAKHPNGYLPALFTFERPKSRDLIESVVGMAGLSRFIVADLSEPRAVQQELQAIVPLFQSVPVVPIRSRASRDLSTFSSLARRPNVAQPTLRYDNADDLPALLDGEVVPRAEALREALEPA